MAVVVGVVAGMGAGAELEARAQVERNLTESLPEGVTVEPHGLLTWGWLRGQVPLTATVDAAAVQQLLSEHVDGVEEVSIDTEAVHLTIAYQTVLGEIPVSVSAIPALADGQVEVGVQSVSALGLTLSAADLGLDVRLTAQDLDLHGVELTSVSLGQDEILVEGVYRR